MVVKELAIALSEDLLSGLWRRQRRSERAAKHGV